MRRSISGGMYLSGEKRSKSDNLAMAKSYDAFSSDLHASSKAPPVSFYGYTMAL